MRVLHLLDRRAQSLRVGSASGWQPSELGGDLLQRQPDALREHDERDPAKHRSREAPVPGPGALGDDQPTLLVEAQR